MRVARAYVVYEIIWDYWITELERIAKLNPRSHVVLVGPGDASFGGIFPAEWDGSRVLLRV